MAEKSNAQTLGRRIIIETLDRAFAHLHARACEIASQVSNASLYEKSNGIEHSVGESILRSAAEVEQTFGGITANLWDDPFEWTLPEHLSSTTKIIGHLNEVEALRVRAFASLEDDSCLSKQVSTPSDTRPLIQLLLDTLLRATEFHTQAVFVHKFLSSISSAGFII